MLEVVAMLASLEPPNGLELSRSAEAGGATHTLAPAVDQHKPHADSADWGRSTFQ
jgi:hypothetical protein